MNRSRVRVPLSAQKDTTFYVVSFFISKSPLKWFMWYAYSFSRKHNNNQDLSAKRISLENALPHTLFTMKAAIYPFSHQNYTDCQIINAKKQIYKKNHIKKAV